MCKIVQLFAARFCSMRVRLRLTVKLNICFATAADREMRI
ncbi:MAG: hypothetical protein ACI9HK_002950 [Pirellulaceae bacterium]|jgi:hypothetical protein